MRNVFPILLLALAAACALPAWAQAPVIRRDFDPVLKHINDRDKFIEAVRTYDRAQDFLAQADQLIADQYIKEGNSGMANAKLKQASDRVKNVRDLYQIALRQYSDSALLLNYYGELLYDRYGDIPGALLHWNKAISQDSSLSHPYNNIGLHEIHGGNYSSGLRNLEMALELDEKNPDYLYNLAQIYLVHWPQVQELRNMDKEKVFKDAMKMSKKAAEIASDDYDLVVDYAVNFFAGDNMGLAVNWKDAAKAWDTARAITRTSEETFYTWLNEARVWIKAGNSTEATRCLREALAIRPQSMVARDLLQSLDPGTEPLTSHRSEADSAPAEADVDADTDDNGSAEADISGVDNDPEPEPVTPQADEAE